MQKSLSSMYYEKLYFFEDNNLEINNEKINFL